MLVFMGLIQVAIAFMTTRVAHAHAPYALGLSLAIYGSSFLLIWPWRYTLALIGITWAALGVSIATAPDSLSSSALATIGFYLGTASLLAFVGQLHRQMTAWDEFRSRVELEAEQERNRVLLEQLERLSREDSLTGLANRRAWDETLGREFERVRRQDLAMAVLLCDLDQLKEINDRFGHAAGDRVLKAAADVLIQRVRAGDLVARLGGDEFAVLLCDTDEVRARAIVERIEEAAAAEEAPGLPRVELAIGTATARDEPLEVAQALADSRMLEAKRGADGRRRAPAA
jgi:diguanylate cyclase (GGDEF)-like protein